MRRFAISRVSFLEERSATDLHFPPSDIAQPLEQGPPSVQGVECDFRHLALSFAVVDAMKGVIADPSLSRERREIRIDSLYSAAGASTMQLLLEYKSFVSATALAQTSETFGVRLTYPEVRTLHIYATQEVQSSTLPQAG